MSSLDALLARLQSAVTAAPPGFSGETVHVSRRDIVSVIELLELRAPLSPPEAKPTRWWDRVRIGQKLVPYPAWNTTTNDRHRKLGDAAEVLRIDPSSSETGVMFTVGTKFGGTICLDAGWFQNPERAKA